MPFLFRVDNGLPPIFQGNIAEVKALRPKLMTVELLSLFRLVAHALCDLWWMSSKSTRGCFC